MDYRQLVGQRLGPGPEIVVVEDRVEAYCQSVGLPPTVNVPLLLVVSLLPALGAGIELPLPVPRATINYGLNRLEQIDEVEVGAVLQATFTIASVEDTGPALQIARTAEISANGKLAAIAETIARLFP